MNNDITVNVEELLELPDHSITDCETIRQIGLIGCDFTGKYNNDTKNRLNRKVNPLYTYAGLYPHIMTNFDVDKLTKDRILKEMFDKRTKR